MGKLDIIAKIATILAPIITTLGAIIAVRLQIKNDIRIHNEPELILIGYDEIKDDKGNSNNKDNKHSEIGDIKSINKSIIKYELLMCHSDKAKIFDQNKLSFTMNFKNIGEGIAKYIKLYEINVNENMISLSTILKKSSTLFAGKNDEFIINVNKFPSGIYFFVIKYNDIFQNKYFNVLKILINDGDELLKVILFDEFEYKNLVIDYSTEGIEKVRKVKEASALSCKETILKAINEIKKHENQIHFNKLWKIH